MYANEYRLYIFAFERTNFKRMCTLLGKSQSFYLSEVSVGFLQCIKKHRLSRLLLCQLVLDTTTDHGRSVLNKCMPVTPTTHTLYNIPPVSRLVHCTAEQSCVTFVVEVYSKLTTVITYTSSSLFKTNTYTTAVYTESHSVPILYTCSV